MRPIFIRSAELGAPFTDRPEVPLRENMLEAAARAVAAAGVGFDEVDALYVAAMGSFTQEHFLGALPLWLAGQLGLKRAYLAPMLSGSSETGAWALRSAFEVMRRGDRRSRHVLVVAGEQMNGLPEVTAKTAQARFEERRARSMNIAQVVDELDRLYGLNMLRLSDLIMDALAQHDGLTQEALRDVVLPFIALEKYGRVKRYPYGQFAAKQPLRGGGLEAYRQRPQLTPYFRLDDVAPTTSGAVAVVLSASPRAGQRPLQIVGMGQGFVPSSMMWRRGPAWRSRAIRDALRGACEDAGVTFDWLLSADFALIHDAFPAIEYFFLRELGLTPEESIRRMISGWSNPLGGLRACGHALGASGLLQVAGASHLVQQDARYLTDADLSQPPGPFPTDLHAPPYSRCFTTSVGGALTNVLATILHVGEGPAQDATPAPAVEIERPPSVELSTFATLRAQVTPIDAACQGRVLARTQLRFDPTFGDDTLPIFTDVRDPWIFLIALDPDPARASALDRTLAYAPSPYTPGDLVALTPQHLPNQQTPCMKVTACLASAPTGAHAEGGLSDGFLADLKARLRQRHANPPPSPTDG